jgi:LysM repeat protein
MRRDRRQLVHFGAPALFLLSVTIVVLILRAGFDGSNAVSTTGTSRTSTVVVTTSAKPMKMRYYTIRPGDTLLAIAIHFRVTVEDIMALNPKLQANSLQPGQKIKIGKAPVQK